MLNDGHLDRFADNPAVGHMQAGYMVGGRHPAVQIPVPPAWNYGVGGYVQPPAAGVNPGVQHFGLDDFLMHMRGNEINGFNGGMDAMQGTLSCL